MPLQTEYDIKDKQQCIEILVDALIESEKPKKNARNLKEFVNSHEELVEFYKDLFKHELLSNFNDLMDGSMDDYDAGDIIILGDKLELEESVEDKIYRETKIELE